MINKLKLSFWTIIAIVVFLYVGCQKQQENLYGALSGSVKDAKGETAVAGALVTLSSGESQTSKSDGSFLFENLEPGEYTVIVSKDGYFTETTSANVKAAYSASCQILLSSSKPELSVSATSLDFGTEQNTLAFDISNPSKGELLWEISAEDEWISCSETSGSLKDGTASIIVRIDRSKMGPGTYSGSVVIVSNAGNKIISVSAKVEGVELTADPSSLNFSTITSSISFIVKNSKETALSYSVSTSNDWISVNKKEGTLMGSDSFTATVTRAGLASGSYSGVIYIGTKNGALIIPVTMEIATNQKPTVTVQSASNETYNSAVFHGNLISVGSEKVTSYGFCWSEKSYPTLSDNVANLGDCSVPSQFEYKATGLKTTTKYYVRSYATNGLGTSYSEDVVSFTTTNLPSAPTVTTGNVSNIGSASAEIGGSLTSLGNVESVTHYGHVWSTKQKPTLGSSEYTDFGKSTSTLSFSSELSSLEAATTYYVRAYATNEIGTSYGDEVEFKTQKANPVVSTLIAANITSSSATCGGRIESSGGHIFSERGVCWSVNSQPTTSDYTSKTGDVTSDTYNCQLADLQAETSYYYRAYVISTDGNTFYGEIKQFITSGKSSVPSVAITKIENITHSSATVFAQITDLGSSNLTETGICWSITSNPTTSDNAVKCFKGTSFTANLNSLPSSSTIYVRAYAINDNGTGYSDVQSFNTSKVTSDIWDGSIATSFGGGLGLENDPIIIRTSSQLALLAKNVNSGVSSYANVYFRLDSNLDLNDIAWTPIGDDKSFQGHFNGNYHIINGINVIESKKDYCGLFGKLFNGSISNLEIYGSVIPQCNKTSSLYTGGLCGMAEKSDIENVHNHCIVSGAGYPTGGICGNFVNSAQTHHYIRNCSNDAKISGYYTTGGIAGRVYGDMTEIINCYNIAEISSESCGGIVGMSLKQSTSATIKCTNCVSAAQAITGKDSTGGILGIYKYSTTIYKNDGICFWLFDASRNIGIEDGKSAGSKYAISSANTCITIPEGVDVVELLNQWVETNGSGIYYKWKYEMIDGLPCPVFDRLK